MVLNRFTSTLLLVLATIFWGFAFVAQKNAMAHMEPLTFIGARYLLGGLVVLPLGLWEMRRRGRRLTRRQWLLVGFLSFNFFIGSWLQQEGLLFTTVTNGGFLTGLYVFSVPVILLIVVRTPPHVIVWICVPLALAGLYLLHGASLDRLNFGDTLIIISSVFWGVHVLMLGWLARDTGMPILISAISFLAAGLAATGGAFVLETPTFEVLSLGWAEIAYTGVMSTAVAFTLQAVGQMHVPPANAAIILSGETLFAALGGAVVLGERLAPAGYAGAAMIFAAIVLVETVPVLQTRRQPAG